THPLAVATDLSVLRGEKVHLRKRALRPLPALLIVVAREPEERCEELHTGQLLPEGIGLRAKTHEMEDLWRSPGRSTEQEDLTLTGRKLPCDELEERRLPRPVRSQEPGDSRRDGDRDVVQGDDRTVPARRASELDRVHFTISTARTRERRTSKQPAAVSA